jgi:hypothetical protein
MQIKISDRAKECSQAMKELSEEMTDYNAIVMCVRALAAVSNSPEKFKYEQEDYDKVVQKLRNLCAKHEIQLPTAEYIEWGTVEIV